MEFSEKILATFGEEDAPELPLMEDIYLNPKAQGDEGATDYFRGKKWTETDVHGLRYHRAALYMFLPEVHRYYLPAFLTVTVKNYEEADEIPDNLILHISSYKDAFWWERIKLFTQAECELLIEFGLWIVDKDDYVDFSDLDKYVEGLYKAIKLQKNA